MTITLHQLFGYGSHSIDILVISGGDRMQSINSQHFHNISAPLIFQNLICILYNCCAHLMFATVIEK